MVEMCCGLILRGCGQLMMMVVVMIFYSIMSCSYSCHIDVILHCYCYGYCYLIIVLMIVLDYFLFTKYSLSGLMLVCSWRLWLVLFSFKEDGDYEDGRKGQVKKMIKMVRRSQEDDEGWDQSKFVYIVICYVCMCVQVCMFICSKE